MYDPIIFDQSDYFKSPENEQSVVDRDYETLLKHVHSYGVTAQAYDLLRQKDFSLITTAELIYAYGRIINAANNIDDDKYTYVEIPEYLRCVEEYIYQELLRRVSN